MKVMKRTIAMLLCLLMCISGAVFAVSAQVDLSEAGGYVEIVGQDGKTLPKYYSSLQTVNMDFMLLIYEESTDDFAEYDIPDDATYTISVWSEEEEAYIQTGAPVSITTPAAYTPAEAGEYSLEVTLFIEGNEFYGYDYFYIGETIPIRYTEVITPDGDYLDNEAELLYTGKKLFTDVIVYSWLTEEYLKKGVDYTVTMGNTKGPGSCMVILDGKGRFTGELAIEITIWSPSAVFTDVKQNGWYVGAINYAIDMDYFKGISATTFAPDASMTRGMFVTVLGRVCGIESGEYSTKTQFSDVPRTQYYSRYVDWASRNGIVNGMTATSFMPDANITREQMCTMILRMNNYMEKQFEEMGDFIIADLTMNGDGSKFEDDAQISSWAKAAVYACKGEGIVNGRPGNLFDPKGNATRAEVATIIENYDEFYFSRMNIEI